MLRGFAVAVLLLAATGARADFFSSSPGALSAAHGALDGKDHCGDCHGDGNAVVREKCQACHKPIVERQMQRKGLHATPKAFGKPCELCHTEHKGRATSLLGFGAFGGIARFDHAALTGFVLDGKHADIACERCHTQKTPSGTRTFLRAQTACVACHANPHGETAAPLRRCERCHDAQSWRAPARLDFNHDKDTRFAIEKKHEGVACAGCHARGPRPPRAATATTTPSPARLTFRWGGWAVDCQPCHDNVHGDSLFGKKACRLCHSARVEFTRVTFDHNRRTRFALDGAHAKTACASCHKPSEKTKPDRRCESCHQDVHKARFANAGDCAACHNAARWTVDHFDHAAKTRFALTGAHGKADCRACHLGKNPADFERLDGIVGAKKDSARIACMSCHKHENVHQRQYDNARCLECHKLAGVLQTRGSAIADVHGAGTRFPLSEGHAGVECAKCHAGNVFKNTPLECGPACHADELHKGTLGADCLHCHAGGRFEARKFDHDKDTRWPLVGNHKDVLCDSCHPRRDFAGNRGLGARCVNCHKKDDVHQGALGTFCERCHDPTGRSLFDHNDPQKSDWPLAGSHARVRCAECHNDTRFKPTRRECGGCHPEPEVHRGQLGTLCSRCHVETSWKKIATGHDKMQPPLGGAHDQVRCVRCHSEGRILAGTGSLCVQCHQKDDIHHNALGPQCADCHSQRSFAGARFLHSRVGCDLVGLHRNLPCADCHVGGNYNAIAPECVACHRKDAVRGASAYAASGGSATAHAGFTSCANCHNPNFFGPSAQPSMRESVCR